MPRRIGADTSVYSTGTGVISAWLGHCTVLRRLPMPLGQHPAGRPVDASRLLGSLLGGLRQLRLAPPGAGLATWRPLPPRPRPLRRRRAPLRQAAVPPARPCLCAHPPPPFAPPPIPSAAGVASTLPAPPPPPSPWLRRRLSSLVCRCAVPFFFRRLWGDGRRAGRRWGACPPSGPCCHGSCATHAHPGGVVCIGEQPADLTCPRSCRLFDLVFPSWWLSPLAYRAPVLRLQLPRHQGRPGGLLQWCVCGCFPLRPSSCCLRVAVPCARACLLLGRGVLLAGVPH